MLRSSKRQVFPTITQSFLHRVEVQPNREVFFTKEGLKYQGITWKEYYENVRLISQGLMQLGARAGENICLLSNTRLEWSACDMAILGTRCVTVPIYASNTADDSAYIANHCEARYLFVEDTKQLEKILSVRNKLPKLEKIIVFNFVAMPDFAHDTSILSLSALKELGKRYTDEKAVEKNLRAIIPTDVFTICYTSGTTGVPKGVVLTFDSLNSVMEDVDQVIGDHVSDQDVLLSFLPLSHIFGKIESMMTYHFGWRVYYAENIEKLFNNIAEVKPTLLFAVPRIFEKAYNKIKSTIDDSSPVKRTLFNWGLNCGTAYYQALWNKKRPKITDSLQYTVAQQLIFKKIYAKFGGRIRYCIAGGAPLPFEIAKFMQTIGITILEGYGLTETCAPITLNTPDALQYGTVGKPLPEAKIRIAEDGEILLKSRKIFREYYKNPSATAEVLENGWFHSGDIGAITTDGFLKITDRKKDLIITSGGKNIAPQKLENLLKTFKYVSQVMVVGDRRKYLSAVFVLDREETVKFARDNNILFSEFGELIKHPKVQSLVQDIINEVNKDLASYETIKKFVILPNEFTIETGELTPSLKLKRKFCTQKYKTAIDNLYGDEEIS